ncbi:ABC transporter permease [bacterium]|nr:ABC transporter permease [bacterium]
MLSISGQAIYMLWLREMKRTWRAKSRLVGALIMPLFFLIFLGSGFRRATMPDMPAGMDYITFLIPGAVGMSLLFSSMFGGLQVLWDKEFGFLKEIMVTPVSRLSIVLGRMAGGSTVSLAQGFMILFLSMLFGFRIHSVTGFLLTVVFMFLIAYTFIGLGLAFASRMKDMHGFQLVMNFVVFPVFFLSGALYPVQGLPAFLKPLVYIDPLTYGVDGLRAGLLGTSVHPPLVDLTVLGIICIGMVTLGSILFETSDVGQ